MGWKFCIYLSFFCFFCCAWCLFFMACTYIYIYTWPFSHSNALAFVNLVLDIFSSQLPGCQLWPPCHLPEFWVVARVARLCKLLMKCINLNIYSCAVCLAPTFSFCSCPKWHMHVCVSLYVCLRFIISLQTNSSRKYSHKMSKLFASITKLFVRPRPTSQTAGHVGFAVGWFFWCRVGFWGSQPD